MVALVACAALVFGLSAVSAHSIFQEMFVNGDDLGQLNGIRDPDSNYPITNVSSNDLICNTNITHMSPMIVQVPQGANITTEWHHQLNRIPNDTDDPIAASHHGPILTYLAKVDDALQKNVTDLKWFKIWEDGFDVATQTWGVDRMVAADGLVNFTLPECIPAGQYLMRHEIIALHQAYDVDGAQFYMECAQLNITGGGNADPATVSFPGAYSAMDPGIYLNIYNVLSNYTVPGPEVFTC